jgi:serine/threonine-protein kinase
MVAIDGGARLLDFGVAKTAMSAHITRNGVFKGKLAYSAPEQVRGAATQQSDLYALCVVLWELLCGRRLHRSASGEAQMVHKILTGQLTTPTEALADERAELGEAQWAQIRALEPIVMRGLATDARARWATAQELESVLTATISPASTLDVASWVRTIGKGFLDDRDRILAEEETSWRRTAGTRVGNDAAPATEVERPPVWRSRRLRIGLVGACVMSVVLLAYAIRRPADTAAAATPPWPSAGAAASPNASASLERTSAQSGPTVTDIASASSTPAPDPTAPPTAPSPVRPVFAPAKPPGARSPPTGTPRTVAHGVARIARVAPPAPPPPPPLATLPPPATDCNPPYYFEGAKKIFKPACL